jgi:hypothetical protein
MAFQIFLSVRFVRTYPPIVLYAITAEVVCFVSLLMFPKAAWVGGAVGAAWVGTRERFGSGMGANMFIENTGAAELCLTMRTPVLGHGDR